MIIELCEALRIAPVPRARALAAERLGQEGPGAHAAIPALLEALQDVDRDVRDSAAVALDQIGKMPLGVMPELRRLLRDRNIEVCLWAALALDRSCPPAPAESMFVLKEALKNGPLSRASEICAVLTRMGAPAAPALVECFVQCSDGRGVWARRALVSLGQRAVVPLVRALNVERQGVSELLCLLCQVAPVHLLAHWLGHVCATVRAEAAVALHQRGEAALEALPELIRAMRDPSARVRLWAVAALLTTGPQASAAIPELIDLLEDPISRTRRLARHTLLRLCG